MIAGGSSKRSPDLTQQTDRLDLDAFTHHVVSFTSISLHPAAETKGRVLRQRLAQPAGFCHSCRCRWMNGPPTRRCNILVRSCWPFQMLLAKDPKAQAFWIPSSCCGTVCRTHGMPCLSPPTALPLLRAHLPVRQSLNPDRHGDAASR